MPDDDRSGDSVKDVGPVRGPVTAHQQVADERHEATVTMRWRRTVQVIQKQVKIPQREGRCEDSAGEDLTTSEASTWCADHKCMAPPDMLTGQSKRACLRREVLTDNEARSRSSSGCRKARVSISAPRASVGDVLEAEAGHVKHARIHAQALSKRP